jgi:hypothetical protein
MAFHPQSIVKARSRLRVAEKAFAELQKAKSHEEFSDTWYTFLTAAKNIYTALENGSKASPKDRQWFGAKKAERQNDELLQYLFQARDDDEHGLESVTEEATKAMTVGEFRPGFSNSFYIDSITPGKNGPNIKGVVSFDGRPVLIERRTHTVLKTVVARGNIEYPPPRTHLGQALEVNYPIPIARRALVYLSKLVAEAERRT